MKKKDDLNQNNKNEYPIDKIDFFQIIDQFFRSNPLEDIMYEFDTILNDTYKHQINVTTYETDKACVLEIQIPPVKKEQVKLELVGQYLTISITNKEEIKEFNENTGTFRNYSSTDSITRTILLPYPVKEHEVKTTFKEGAITVTIPKNPQQNYLSDE